MNGARKRGGLLRRAVGGCRPEWVGSCRWGAGFTLVEVLAAMAVLVILMMGLMRIYPEAVKAFQKGNTAVEQASSVRAAMDVIRRDFEGLVVDRRLAMYQVADEFSNNYDAVFFSSMGVQPTDADTRSYMLVWYYVDITNRGYNVYRLKRATRRFDVSRATYSVDPMVEPTRRWWMHNKGGFDHEVILENVVRFDIYIHDVDGNLISTVEGGVQFYDSTRKIALTGGGTYPSNKPPAYVDVFLQVTSPQAEKEASFLFEKMQMVPPKDRDYYFKMANDKLYRESRIVLERITPRMGPAEVLHPLSY